MMISTCVDEQKFLDSFVTHCTLGGGALLVHLGSSRLVTFVVVGGGDSANLTVNTISVMAYPFKLRNLQHA